MRSPFLFEVGEEMKVRIERNGTGRMPSPGASTRRGPGGKITELELSDVSKVTT